MARGPLVKKVFFEKFSMQLFCYFCRDSRKSFLPSHVKTLKIISKRGFAFIFRLFEDVNPVLQQLHDEEFRLYIFSSGSIEAQKLLVTYSTEGDISEVCNYGKVCSYSTEW